MVGKNVYFHYNGKQAKTPKRSTSSELLHNFFLNAVNSTTLRRRILKHMFLNIFFKVWAKEFSRQEVPLPGLGENVEVKFKIYFL